MWAKAGRPSRKKIFDVRDLATAMLGLKIS